MIERVHRTFKIKVSTFLFHIHRLRSCLIGATHPVKIKITKRVTFHLAFHMNPQAPPQPQPESSDASTSSTEAAFSAFYLFSGARQMTKQWIENRAQGFKSLGTFLDKSKISLPPLNVTEAVGRVKTNLTYFQTNYLLVFVFLFILGVYVDISNLIFVFLTLFDPVSRNLPFYFGLV